MSDPVFLPQPVARLADNTAILGDKMTTRQGKSGSSYFKRITHLASALLILLPYSVRAESIYLKQTAELLSSGIAFAEKHAQRSADFTMDQNGNVVMRCLNMSFTVAHGALEETPALREMIQRLNVQLTPDHAGIKVKVGFAF
jgi:hypothetical protein